MPLTRLDNLISSKTGKYLYVSPDDFNATDALSNRGNSPVTPFKSIQRAFLEIARYSYLPGFGNDRFDQFSIMLMPGIHYIDNRPGLGDTTGIDVFGFDQANNEWTDDSILDISNPDNVLYKFNNTEGGAIIPRGSSLVGYDLRRTVVRPLYVPDPASVTVPRSAIFNVTGGCYFWQFTIKDGQTTAESPLYNTVDGTGEVYYDPNDFTRKTAPNYSHHKLTVFEYADTEELGLFYRKIAKGFSAYQPTIDDPGEFDFRVQENRIVGPLSDSRVIESLTLRDATTVPSIAASTSEIEVTTKVDHGYFAGQFVAISNTEIDTVLEGIFPIKSIDQNDPRKFTYEVAEVVSAIGTGIASGQTVSVDTTPALGQNAQTLAEVDSVESASPYVFNCSIRSTWGICGIWANGLKATGFKSMVIAQYTGVSLQKDDRAFIRYDEYSNTWNQASLTDAFATVPYHAKGDSYWKDDWRNFHVRASEDAFIQNVSIFAVGFADHFLMESGGDMSITNSNSNFGNTSLHAIGFKGFAFNQDKGGYISDIIPPKIVEESLATTEKTQYYTIDIQGSIQDPNNYTKLFLGTEDVNTPIDRPAVSLNGYRLGAKTEEKLYVKLDPATAGGTEEFNVTLEPTGFVKYIAAPQILNPSGFAINNVYADAANLIESNRRMIQEEVFGYILEKYPRLQNISYVNPGRDPNANRYFDARNLINQNRQEIISNSLNSLGEFVTGASIQSEDLGELVDAVAEDLRDGGNSNTIKVLNTYFDGTGALTKYASEQENFIWAISRLRDEAKKAIANLLGVKADLYDPSGELPDFSGYNNLPTGPIVNGYTGSSAEEANLTTNGVTIDLSQKIDPASRYKDTYNLIRDNKNFITDYALAEIAVYHDDFYFPGDAQEEARSRFKDAYRFIRRTKDAAQTRGIDQIQIDHPTFVFPGGDTAKCRRDLGYFIDAIGLDIYFGGNSFTRQFISQYFLGNNLPIANGLDGENTESITGFNAVRDYLQDAVSNQLTSVYQDLSISPGEAVYGDGNGDVTNTDATACTDVQNAIASLTSIVTQCLTDNSSISLADTNNANYVTPTIPTYTSGEQDCRDDIQHIIDAIQQDLWFGGNAYTIAATKAYFNKEGVPILNGLTGETDQGVTAFKRIADGINLAINNQLYVKDFSITLDTTGDPPIVSDMNADAYDLVLKNKAFIAKEAYERMLVNFPTYVPQPTNTEQDCLDDVMDVLEEVMWNVKFGGNHKAWDAANVYVTNTFNGQAVETFIDSERDEAADVFNNVIQIIPEIIRQTAVTVSSANPLTQYIDNTIVDDWETPTCDSAVSATQTLLGIVVDAIGTDSGVGSMPDPLVVPRTEPTQPSTGNVFPQPGGYTEGNCSDVLQTVDTLISILCDAVSSNSLDSLPPLNNGEWDCANVRSSIETLFDIVIDSVSDASNADLPPITSGGYTTDAEQSKCFRDVSYIVDAVVSDLRLGGNINSVQAGEAYYVGMDLEYIDGEKAETLDAWNYVGQMATAAMRNFDYLRNNCSITAGSPIVDVGDTRGILIGMKVAAYAINPNPYEYGLLQPNAVPDYSLIPPDTYVKRIFNNTQIELGVRNARFDLGATQAAGSTDSNASLYFTFENGQWADTLPKTVVAGPASSDPDVVQDTQYPECGGTADAIDTLIGNITTIINNGVGSVDRVDQTVSVNLFASRATVFTINTTGYGASNPHNFETGTPVRLVPRPRFDVAKGQYVDVDKRLVRLPNGFETNTTYYVIAPGRRTQPEDYSNTTFFNGSDQTKLMLATSPENAAAGIYIYASESGSIDPDVEIDIYQFIQDQTYDLHNYKCTLTNAVNAGIQTDVSHIFDVPFSSVNPQKVFFRPVEGQVLPNISTTYANDPDIAVVDSSSADFGRINPVKEFFARYQNDNVFTIHKTHADAINNVNPITFTSGQTQTFEVFANKRSTPVKFDPAFSNGITTTGKWYINVKDEGSSSVPQNTREENILWRIQQSDYSDRPRSTDMWFTRLKDDREADDRTYKLRYVIPKYLENARDPINGFAIKTRTDDTRKLVPQKVLLKPVSGTVYGARFENPVQAGEFIGFTAGDIAAASLNPSNTYDPYKKDQTGQGIEYRAFAKFNSGIQATIQSGRYVEDIANPEIKYLELTLYDHGVDTLNFPGLRNESFTTVQINAPQGGAFVVNKTQSVLANQVEWTGNSSGIANIHAYYSIGGNHYLILKNVRGGKLEYSEYTNTTFEQGSVFANMLDDQDMGKSLPLKTLIRKNYPQYYYKQNGANVYTITPGDTIQDDAGIEYYVDSVEDAGVIEDTFYVFSYETLQRRIAGQQDGIYYLSCLRGNISPFPTGAGVADNFKKFKFSQPVSSLYPLNYRNDPLWFQKNGTTAEELDVARQLLDPPATFCAADNYIHGLVTTNDYKNSVTKEGVIDLIEQPAFADRKFVVEAQSGNATSGSEDRKIPIAGDSGVVSDQRYYVELRRPSIARAGNHTFEYLGFGPGNYSTGLPARQEIVLTPTEDFYAQSKKQDAGIVFYTGLNSNGDLYIGNRKINAITGEETFLEQAILREPDTPDDPIGTLVTSFDTPVTFNQNITVVGGDGSQQNVFQSPVIISVQDNDFTEVPDSLTIRSNVSSVDPITQVEQDETLDRTNFRPPTTGDIRLSKNRIQAAVYGWNARGGGQGYQIQTHITNGVPSNISPDNSPLVANGGSRVYSNQSVNYSGVAAKAGDILLKGREVGKSGSLGWVYANYYTEVPGNNIFTIEFDGTNVVKVSWRDSLGVNIPNSTLGITSGSQIRLTNYPDTRLNAVWTVFSPNGDAFSVNNNYVHFQVNDSITIQTLNWSAVLASSAGATLEFSNSNWKEYGLIGGEALRTDTETWGNFKLGINTTARSSHDASQNGFVSLETEPRANLDVVGTAFISGKTINSYLTEITAVKTETNEDNALLVGGDSTDPSDDAVFRVMTTNNGRVGINTAVNDVVNPFRSLDRTFVVVGDARIHEDLEITGDLQVNDGDITTTNAAFNFVNTNANVLNWGGEGQILNLVNNSTISQSIAIANSSPSQSILIGEGASSSVLKIHRNSDNADVDIATVSNDVASSCQIDIGGAWATQSNTNSYVKFGTFFANFAGNLEIGSGYGAGTSASRIYTQTRVANLFDGDQTNTVNLALNATTFQMGSTGGTSTIRNTLNVLASAIVEGDIRLDGGLKAGIIEVARGRFGTGRIPHSVAGIQNPNIDFYQYNDTGRFIDTAGVSQWGSTAFLVAGGQISSITLPAGVNDNTRIPGNYTFLSSTTTGGGDGAVFTVSVGFDPNRTINVSIESPGEGYAQGDQITITATQLGGVGPDLIFTVNSITSTGSSYYLPITTPAVNDFAVGDLLLLDRANAISPDSVGSGSNIITGLRDESRSEIVRIIGISNIVNPQDPNGYRLIVSRGDEGTNVNTDHPDGCVIAKLVKQSNASYITGADNDGNGVIDEPIVGIGDGPQNVAFGIAEFGGTLSTRDYLRLSGTEFVSVVALISTDPQSLIVNDGGTPASDVFRVESTTGNTVILGDVGVGVGFNKFTIDSVSGNTNIAGTLTTENTLTINGSRQVNTEFFRITDGGDVNNAARTTLEVDTATGDLDIYGGNFNIWSADGATPRLTLVNSSGDFTVYGSLSALGTGTSTFGGSLDIANDIEIRGGDLTLYTKTARTGLPRNAPDDVRNVGDVIFSVSDDGGVNIAGMPDYFTPTGGRRWEYSANSVITGESNVNYFLNCVGNTLFRLPDNAEMGDMIRIIDIGGALTYNLSLVIRAPDDIGVQGSTSNTGATMISGIGNVNLLNYNGGELIVQTPRAGLALVFAGPTTSTNEAGAPSSQVGWYILDV